MGALHPQVLNILADRQLSENEILVMTAKGVVHVNAANDSLLVTQATKGRNRLEEVDPASSAVWLLGCDVQDPH